MAAADPARVVSIRDPLREDAPAIRAVRRAIIAVTGRERSHDVAFVCSQYVANPASVARCVAVDGAGVVPDFQSLVPARPDDRYDVPAGRGTIATHTGPAAHRRGIGRLLFSASLAAARQSGIARIDATITTDDTVARGYHKAMSSGRGGRRRRLSRRCLWWTKATRGRLAPGPRSDRRFKSGSVHQAGSREPDITPLRKHHLGKGGELPLTIDTSDPSDPASRRGDVKNDGTGLIA